MEQIKKRKKSGIKQASGLMPAPVPGACAGFFRGAFFFFFSLSLRNLDVVSVAGCSGLLFAALGCVVVELLLDLDVDVLVRELIFGAPTDCSCQ